MSESGVSTHAVRGSVSDLGSGRSTPPAVLAEPEAAAIGVYSVVGEIPDEDIASVEPLLGAEKAAEAKETEKEKVQQMKKPVSIGIPGTPVTEDEVRFFFSLLSLLTAFLDWEKSHQLNACHRLEFPSKKTLFLRTMQCIILHLPVHLYRIASFSESRCWSMYS
jgi:hypothetical protein